MIPRISFCHHFIVFCIALNSLTSTVFAQAVAEWTPDERSGLGLLDARLPIVPLNSAGRLKGKVHERMIRIPVNGINRAAGYYDLYYFVRMPEGGIAPKTVLYCTGGPGQFMPGPALQVTLADFLTEHGYNVVYYHPRGTGVSQLPPSNEYDKFLRASFVIRDLEAIRKDFLGDRNWNAVIGLSYGTVIAQQYAHNYQKLDKLILVGPQSRHNFNNTGVFDQFVNEVTEINRRTLESIFQYSEFANNTAAEKLGWTNHVFGTAGTNGIFRDAEDKFGSILFIINSYCQLDMDGLLASNNLRYSRRFFTALANLRLFGALRWPQGDPIRRRQVDIGIHIRDELLGISSDSSDCSPDLTGSSDRVFYAVGVYDGINARFLKHWLANNQSNIVDAVKASAGEVHYGSTNAIVNKYVGKVGISNSDVIRPWDPAKSKHGTPTLVLKGGADSVAAGGAAEHFFVNAADGRRVLIGIPNVGHWYLIPRIASNSDTTGPACRPTIDWTLECLIFSFLEMNDGFFNTSDIVPILNTIITNYNATVCFRTQNSAHTVSGTCP